LFATTSLYLDLFNGFSEGSIQARASIDENLLNTDPFSRNVFDLPLDPDGKSADTGINLVWELASLGVGEKVSFEWVTSMNKATNLNDHIVLLATQARIDAGAGDDIVFASDPDKAEILIGGSGDDFLHASVTVDTLDASLGANLAADTLIGGSGSDKLLVDQGVVTMTGGTGADLFVFEDSDGLAEIFDNIRFSSSGMRTSRITDFVSGSDKIVINNASFDDISDFISGPLISGPLISGVSFSKISAEFKGTNSGVNTNHGNGLPTFIYSEHDAVLYYDSDGLSAGYQVIAHVGNLSASDIVVTTL
ncbi:MAG: hypothetical protein HQ492_11425, partial [Woeseiaceae bacterium]|nr:hypothetical protein [Woeseiaceae bacterium]